MNVNINAEILGHYGKCRNYILMYIDKKIKYVVNIFFLCAWRRPIEHTKTFSGQIVKWLKKNNLQEECMLYHFKSFKTNVCWLFLKRWFSKDRPSGPMLFISRNVHLSVCVSVCLSVCSLLRYRLTVFFPPFPKVGCPIFLEIRNPWGKVMERNGLTFEHFCFEMV